MLPILLALLPVQDQVTETLVTAPRSYETVTETPALVTEISHEELVDTGERSLPRAIEKAAGGGLWLQETNLGGGAPIIRGQVGNRILIVVDGVRVNDATTRLGPNQALNNFDVNDVERVEVVYGPASVLWGSDAIGGAILIWTKRAGTTGLDGAELDVRGGVSGRWDTSYDGGNAALDAALSGRRWGLFATANWFSYGDLDTGGDGPEPITGYHGRSYFASFEHDLDEARSLRFTADVHRDMDVPRTDKVITGFGQTEPAFVKRHFTLQDRRRFTTFLTDRTDYGFSERSQLRLSYRTYVETRERRANEGGGVPSDTKRFERDEVETLGLGADFRKALGDDHLLTYGLDVERDEVDSERNDLDVPSGTITPNDGAFAPDAEYRRAGLFVQDETRFGGFEATFGARYSFYDFQFDDFDTGEQQDGDFDAVTASVQVARRVTENTRLIGTVAQGFRAPNLDDLANEKGFAGGTELGNPDLEPEESLTYDLSAEWSNRGWDALASVYYTRIDDVLGRVLIDEGDPGTTGDETYLRENVGELELFGVETGLRHPLPVFESGGDPQVFGAYSATWTKGIQKDPLLDPDDGEVDARRIPPLFGRAAIEVRPHERVLGVDWLDLELRWADEQDDLHPQDVSDPRIDPDGTPGWGVVNVDLGGRATESLTWNAGVHNVFDKSYRVHATGFDGPGLGFVFGAEWRP